MDGQAFSISVQSGYVFVEDSPDYDIVWSKQLLKLRVITDVCTNAGCKKVIILRQKANVKLATIDIFRFGEEVAKRHLQVAIVNSRDASRADEEFLENVTTNRGSPIKFFNNVEDAKRWLGV